MAEHGDNSEKRDEPEKRNEEGLPEVEAELVSATAPAADAFEDDAPEAEAAADADAGETAEDNVTPKRPSTLTPGVILFLIFVVVALGAFAVWRLNFSSPAEPAAESAEARAVPTAPAPAANEETVTLEIEQPADPAPDKITNVPADELQPETGPDAPAASTDDAPGSFLPPVTEGDAAKLSNSVEEGAKEAMRRFRETEQENAIAPQTDEVPVEDESITPDAEETASEPVGEVEEVVAPEPAGTDSVVQEGAEAEQAAFDAERLALEERFAAEKQQWQAELASAQQRNDELGAEIERMRAALDEAALRIEAAETDAREARASAEQIRNEDASASERQMKAAFALSALSRAVDQGAPFAEELSIMSQFDAAAGALEAHAQTGVATDADLRARFGAAARAALSAAALEEADSGPARLMARARNLVSLRPARPTDGDAPGAVLSRAEHALEQGEITFALLQLEDLPLAAQAAMADWIEDARARAEAQSALTALAARINRDAELGN